LRIPFDLIRDGTKLTEPDDLVVALRPVVQSLIGLGIRFYVGGSVASSFHGAVRSTMDVDLLCELDEPKIQPLLQSLGNSYYASEPAIRDAVRRKSCFNLIHLATSFKVDIFVSRQRPFDSQAIDRAKFVQLAKEMDLQVPMASPEDIILIKLEWYRLGGETSERQWNDVSRLMSMLGDIADKQYLRSTSETVGVRDLLERLLVGT
jgi:hypothetical protein